MTSPNDLLCVLCGSTVGRVDSNQTTLAICKAIGDGLPLKAGSKPGRIWHRSCGSPAWGQRPEVDGRVGTNASALSRSAVGWSPMGPVWAGTPPAPAKASGPSPAEVKALADLRADNLRLKAEHAGLVKPAVPANPGNGLDAKAIAQLQAELAKVKAEHARLMAETEAEAMAEKAEADRLAMEAWVKAQNEATAAQRAAEAKAMVEKAAADKVKAEAVKVVPPTVTPTMLKTMDKGTVKAPDTTGMCWRDRRLAELAAIEAAKAAPAPEVKPAPVQAAPAPVQPPVVLPPAPVAPPVMVQPVAPVQPLPVHGGPVRIPVDRATYAALLRAMELPADELITMAMDRTPIRLGSTVGPVVVELVLS